MILDLGVQGDEWGNGCEAQRKKVIYGIFICRYFKRGMERFGEYSMTDKI
jgi:hypothetical protein